MARKRRKKKVSQKEVFRTESGLKDFYVLWLDINYFIQGRWNPDYPKAQKVESQTNLQGDVLHRTSFKNVYLVGGYLFLELCSKEDKD